ncbi:uncharacterized protein LOC112010575 [Quercus suber]|uniref:uncharacterized protein LOC112010575 n=1 Tax=Quercus suber TaxID=58331 RepID=UPI000CE20BC2|nr:uncharacterized protein LOC112010575 [Quercus suber]
MAALPILRSGCCWRVGNGESIDVTKDKWIPNYLSNKLLHPVIDMKEGWKVSNLIDWDIHGWRRDILMAKFNRDEVEAVCRIPLSRRVMEDSMVWLHNRRGVYTVRSGYHLARQRACHDVLPTGVNLAKRKIISDMLCHCCKSVTEDTLHAVWGYGAAQDVWAGSLKVLQKFQTNHVDFLQLFEALVDRLSTTEMELFLVQAWLIWNQRNVMVHGGQMKNPGWLTKRAAELLEEYKKAQATLEIPRATPGRSYWKPPPQEVYKLNFDAAIFSNLNCSGVGAIIRKFDGGVMAGIAAKGDYVHNSDDAEALACRKDLEFAREAGFSSLIIEGDNLKCDESNIKY